MKNKVMKRKMLGKKMTNKKIFPIGVAKTRGFIIFILFPSAEEVSIYSFDM